MIIEAALKAVIALPLILFIPGFLIFNALDLKKVTLRFSEGIFIQILISILLSSLLGIFLAELGLFSLINLLLFLLGLCITLISLTKKARSSLLQKLELNYESISLISILILLLLLLIIFPPAEWVIGTYDGGFYINTGVNIARTGSIVIHDQLIAKINQNTIPLNQGSNGYALINGFALTDPQNGEIFPLLYNMFPIWIAIFYSIFGIWGTIYVAPFFGLMGILSVYMVGRQVTNWQVATISSLFLSLNFIQLFFSRTPYTEVIIQFFIFSALFSFIIYKKLLNKEFAIISAISFAITMFIHIDSFILLLPFFIYYLYLKIINKMKNCDVIFVNAFLLVSAYSIIHALKFNFIYSDRILENTIGKLISGTTSDTIFYLILLAFSIFFIYINYFNLKESFGIKLIERINEYINKKVKYILFLFIVAFAAYVWFIRPYGAVYSLETSNAFNMIRLSQFLTPFLLLCGIIGLLIFVNSIFEKGRFYLTGLFLVFFVIFIINVLHSPPLPWMMRRYLPVVIPSIMIFAGYFIYRFIEFLPIRKLFRYLSIILIVLAVGINYLQADYILHDQKMWDSMINKTRQISDFVDDDIIVFGGTPTAQLLASPIKYIYGKNVIYTGCDINTERDQFALDKLKSNFGEEAVNTVCVENTTMLLKALNGISNKSLESKKKILIAEINTTNITKLSKDFNFIEVIKFDIPFKLIRLTYEEIPKEMNGYDATITMYELQNNSSSEEI